MATRVRRHSVLRLWVELVEEVVVLVFLELKRAVHEIRENIRTVEQGALFLVLAAATLFFASLAFLATAIAVLSVWLQTWAAALIVAVALALGGVGMLLIGLADFKHFSLVPDETLHRVKRVFQQYKKVEAEHQAAGQVRQDPEPRRRAPGRGHAAQ